jgi:hypothetical protein
MPGGIAEGMNRLRIFELRDEAVVLDSVLAAIYGVTTANFDKVIRRNLHPFPNASLRARSLRIRWSKLEHQNAAAADAGC